MDKPGCSPEYPLGVDPTYFERYKHYQAKRRAVSDPTTLIFVDEGGIQRRRSVLLRG